VSVSVAIVGAGVIGPAAAFELSRRGAEVVVLERREPGAGASSGNAGWIHLCSRLCCRAWDRRGVASLDALP